MNRSVVRDAPVMMTVAFGGSNATGDDYCTVVAADVVLVRQRLLDPRKTRNIDRSVPES